MSEATKIGIIGCGNISGIYFKNLVETFGNVEVKSCADLKMEAAQAKADEYESVQAVTVDELLADPEIEIVVNLTIPGAHAEVACATLNAGKHTYGEKPLAVNTEDGKKIMALAKEKGLRVGSAPDTFLGGGIQTCAKLIEDGAIGRPVAATAFMMCGGHETWHPSPEFYYQQGGGPMFDMGPYYLTALVALLGPAKRITGSCQKAWGERTITSEPKYGKVMQVDVPTHVAGVVDFAGGAVASIITSFDIMHGANLPRIEIYGTEGTLTVPDPNTFGGPVVLKTGMYKDAGEVNLTHAHADNSRGIGVADLASAVRNNRPHRASGELAMHVLEMMEGVHTASANGSHLDLTTTCEKPAVLPTTLKTGEVE
ncbi:MAG: Gfo/Idh/MocA family protein [Planctomycetota bacterium]|jgi:predicted dehydrogenase